MKTNQSNRNRSTNGANRRPLNRTGKPNNQRTTGLSGVKSRIGKPGNNKPKIDLRQVLAKKVKPSADKPSTAPVSSNVKSRLGLQSRTARLEALKEARAQLKSVQRKTTKNLKDAKPTNSQIKKTVPASITKNRPEQRNQLNRKPITQAQIRQERDRQLNDRNLITRRPIERSVFKTDYRTRNDRVSGLKSVAQPIIIQPQYIPQTQPAIIYQQPSHHHSSYEAPNRFVSRSEINLEPEVTLPVGNSVLVSNLSPKITEDEVAELFGDIGPLMNVQIINSSTALVTYFAAQHASTAVKVYNYRLLDGIAMNCTVLPSTTSAAPQSSSQQPLYSGRMYSDAIPVSSHRNTNLRQNYHLGL